MTHEESNNIGQRFIHAWLTNLRLLLWAWTQGAYRAWCLWSAMANIWGYDALVTPECGHTMGQCGLPIAGRRSCRYRAQAQRVKACMPIKSHQLIVTAIILTIFNNMRCEHCAILKDPILEELLHYLCFLYFLFQAGLLQVCSKWRLWNQITASTEALLFWWRSDQDPDALQNDLDRALETQPIILKCAYVWQMWKFVGILGLILVEAIFFYINLQTLIEAHVFRRQRKTWNNSGSI